jgi:hypothetical protein
VGKLLGLLERGTNTATAQPISDPSAAI